jgi:hypothetical protein
MKRKIQIERGVPIPKINHRNGRSSEADALLEMQVGDSFIMADARKIYSSAKWFGIRVKVRKFFEAGSRKWKYRVWRIQ